MGSFSVEFLDRLKTGWQELMTSPDPEVDLSLKALLQSDVEYIRKHNTCEHYTAVKDLILFSRNEYTERGELHKVSHLFDTAQTAVDSIHAQASSHDLGVL